jgi:formate hydrogenlyase transcriptional activator
LDIYSLQKIVLAIAESESIDAVLQTTVRGLAGQPDVALTRIWLIEPGDLCRSCVMRGACADQTRCLHLAASAGHSIIDRGRTDGPPEDWTRMDGYFQRIPLSTSSQLEHVPTTDSPIHIRVEEATGRQSRFFRPDWVKAERIRSLVGQPLVFKNAVLGALSVFSRAELTDHEVAWLRAIADHAAVALGTLQTASRAATLRANVAAMAERWRSVFEKSAIGVALTDENGRFLHVNHAYEEILGYSEVELRKLSFYDITPEEFRESNRALAADLWAGKCARYQLEKPYRRKDGSLIWVRLHGSIVPGTKSVSRFGLALCEDITERKRAEESLRKSEDRWRTLLEINNALVTNLSENTLLHAISNAIRRVVPFDRAALTLYLPEKRAFRYLGMESRLSSDYFRSGTEFDPGSSVSAWVFDHQQAIVRGDLEKQQQYANDIRLVAEGLRSDCVVPLILRGKSLGTLNVGSTARNQYSEADAQFLQEIAKQVALAFENMKSYEEIAALKAKLEVENIYLQEEIRTEHNFEEIIGNSPALLEVLRAVEQVAPTNSTVLIVGETGTGKELIARAIHNRSERKDRPLVRVDCSAISAGLVESELFGHMKGAFTGAFERHTGRFELADGGTILLDEIGELPLEAQAKLLRVLQEHEFEPVGSSRSLHVDVRVIAATNRNLEEAVNTGRFRSDLFYRLNVFPLKVPPLRDRRSDIPQLVEFCLSRSSKKFRKKVDTIAPETMTRLMNYPWPGNVRELQNVIERAVILSSDPALQLNQEFLPGPSSAASAEALKMSAQEPVPPVPGSTRLSTLDEVERSHILAALQRTGGIIEGPKGAAKILNLHPNTLRHRMQKHGIARPGHRQS